MIRQRPPRPDASALKSAAHAALRLASSSGWRELTLAEISREADLKLSDLQGLTHPNDLIPTIVGIFDAAMSDEGPDMSEPARERLFDVIMLRFEAMEEHRAGLLALHHATRSLPSQLANRAMAFGNSARWALVSAGLDAELRTLTAPIYLGGLDMVIRQAEAAWREEESQDFARTMAALDKGLRELDERMARVRDPLGAFDRMRSRTRKDDRSGPEAPD